MTSAVRKLWIAEGVKSVDDLACLYTTPRQVCYHMDEHNLEDANIDSAVQGEQSSLQELPLRENLCEWCSEVLQFTNPDTGDDHDQRASIPSVFAGNSSATAPGNCGNGSSFQLSC